MSDENGAKFVSDKYCYSTWTFFNDFLEYFHIVYPPALWLLAILNILLVPFLRRKQQLKWTYAKFYVTSFAVLDTLFLVNNTIAFLLFSFEEPEIDGGRRGYTGRLTIDQVVGKELVEWHKGNYYYYGNTNRRAPPVSGPQSNNYATSMDADTADQIFRILDQSTSYLFKSLICTGNARFALFCVAGWFQLREQRKTPLSYVESNPSVPCLVLQVIGTCFWSNVIFLCIIGALFTFLEIEAPETVDVVATTALIFQTFLLLVAFNFFIRLNSKTLCCRRRQLSSPEIQPDSGTDNNVCNPIYDISGTILDFREPSVEFDMLARCSFARAGLANLFIYLSYLAAAFLSPTEPNLELEMCVNLALRVTIILRFFSYTMNAVLYYIVWDEFRTFCDKTRK